MNSAASVIMVARGEVEVEVEVEEAAALLVEHTREALVESEENVRSNLEPYQCLVSSFVSNHLELSS
jgi:hypothetical protein